MSAYVFEIDLSSDHGGLDDCLKKAGVSDAVSCWVTSDAPSALFAETLCDFVHFFSEANYEKGIKEKLTSAKLPVLAAACDLNKQISRLRRAWMCGHHNLQQTTKPASPPVAAMTDAEMEGPLPPRRSQELARSLASEL